ncbi:MAG: hypothetical protein PHI56_09215 [Victivallaceae bacterium]|nr:hypothetical protein [Victivallaceae bacterium]
MPNYLTGKNHKTCNNKIGFLGLFLLGNIFLFSGCHAYTLNSSLATQYHPSLSARLAKSNNLEPNDIEVKSNHFKANYCNITFKKMPPSGKYDITPFVNSLKKLKINSVPVFLHFYIPGGNLTDFLKIPVSSLQLEKTGTNPITFDPDYRVANDFPEHSEWDLENWTMDDLRALPGNTPFNILDIRMAPQEKFDWTFLQKFPELSVLRLTNASGFINAEKLAEVNCSLLLNNNKNTVLPKTLNCWSFGIGGENVDDSLLSHINPEKLTSLHISRSSTLQLTQMKRFQQLRRLHIADCHSLGDLTMFAGMPVLNSLEITNCPVKDVSGITNIRQLRLLYLNGTA